MSQRVEKRVLDASALLAYLQDEPGAETVRAALVDGCVMSAVNWAEVLSKSEELVLGAEELISELTSRGVLGACLTVLPFAEADAPVAATLRPPTRHLGLSLADRACLALGLRLEATVLTADRTWRDLDPALGVSVLLIR